MHQRSLRVVLGRKLSGIGAPLRFDVVKSTPLENAAVMKVQVAFDEKLRRPVKAFLEGRCFGGQARMQSSGAEDFREPAECLVPRLPEDERLRERIGEGPDAELDGAAILDERCGVDRRGVILKGNGLLRRSEQRELECGAFENVIERRAGKFRFALHVGHRAVHLSDDREWRAAFAALKHRRKDFKAEVGVRGQAISRRVALSALCDELPEDIHAKRQEVLRGIGVIKARVALLGQRTVQEGACLKEEIVHFDVGRELAALQRCGVFEIGELPEDALDQRTGEPAFEIALEHGLHEAERREYRERYGLVPNGPPVKSVDEMVRLADRDGHGEHDLAANLRQHRFDAGFGVIMNVGEHEMQSGQGK